MCLQLGFRKIRLEASDVGAHKVDLFISGRVSAEIVGKVRVDGAVVVKHALDEMISNVETTVCVASEFVVNQHQIRCFENVANLKVVVAENNCRRRAQENFSLLLKTIKSFNFCQKNH